MSEKGVMLPGEDYVVVPVALRDRILARLKVAEGRVETLTAELREAQEMIENVRQVVGIWQAVLPLIRAMAPWSSRSAP